MSGIGIRVVVVVGGSVVVVGAAVARSGEWGAGTQVLLVGLALSAVGTAVVVGAALEAGARRREVGGWRSPASLAAAVAGAVLIVGTLGFAGPGRAGLPEDGFSGAFAFAAPEDAPTTRILIFGPAVDLPGGARDFDGLGYRVFTPPLPSSWDAILNEPRLGDEALEQVLRDLVDGRSRRAGEELADFGIGWIVFTEQSPLEALFEAQLDLVTLRSLDFPVFRNEAPAFVAHTVDGDGWIADGAGFRPGAASPSAGVIVATNADYRWGPGIWSQDDWANRIDGVDTSVGFTAHGGRRLGALAAFGWLVVPGGAWVAGRVAARRSS